jgi:hypothetical protein
VSVVLALFAIGAGSSLLAFPAACLYSHNRAASAQRSYVTLCVVEFIGMYFLGVAAVSCFASIKFSAIMVSHVTSRHVTSRRHCALPSDRAQAGTSASQSTEADVDLFLKIASGMYACARFLCPAVVCCTAVARRRR